MTIYVNTCHACECVVVHKRVVDFQVKILYVRKRVVVMVFYFHSLNRLIYNNNNIVFNNINFI
jgi:hypothetical protein